MEIPITRGDGKRLKIQFRIGWDDGHADALPITLGNQRLEKLFRWEADLGSNRLSCEILWVHFVLAQFMVDSHLIQKAALVF